MRLRIDDLARESGVTSRNIRAFQAKGLLQPPELAGRTGWYGAEHLQRLEMIEDLQQRGFSLAAVGAVVEAIQRGGDLTSLVGLHNLLTAPWTDELEPVRISANELFSRFPEVQTNLELVQQALDVGVIVAVPATTSGGEVSFDVPSPVILEVGEILTGAGVPLGGVLDLVKRLRTDVGDIADAFVGLVADELLLPAARDTAGPGITPGTIETLRRLRPLALEVVRPFLGQELSRAIAQHLRRVGVELSDAVNETPPIDPTP